MSPSVPREQQEREKALQLQRERLQRELEEKKKKVGAGRGSCRGCTEHRAGETGRGEHTPDSWPLPGSQEEQQRLAEQRLQEEQERKAKEADTASKALNLTVNVEVSPLPLSSDHPGRWGMDRARMHWKGS